MDNYNIYEDISKRTNGDIYIGVVGPVRTGKSTFIKRFMDLFVIPNMTNEYMKERTRDELPQSSDGTTIMTTEPKFIPNESAEIMMNENISFRVKMVDCVGYIINGASGHYENGMPRMVRTPWSENEMLLEKAAEMGTDKVIKDHATLGVVMTTDGSITGIGRENYVEAEEKTINQLKAINKPFVVLLNSNMPYSEKTKMLASQMEEKYNVRVMPINCLQMKKDDITKLLKRMLYEFPTSELKINFPKWVESLDDNNWLKKGLVEYIKSYSKDIDKICDIKKTVDGYSDYEHINKPYLNNINLGTGVANVDITLQDGLFYKILSEEAGMDIEGDHNLIKVLKDLSNVKKKYEKVAYALTEVENKGYGVVIPSLEELNLEDPQIIKKGNNYGVKLKARGPSIHLIKADIETEMSPMVGTEQQSEDLLNYLTSEVEDDPSKIWQSNLFGKPLHELVSSELENKINKMNYTSQERLQETLQRVINDGSGNLICIIL